MGDRRDQDGFAGSGNVRHGRNCLYPDGKEKMVVDGKTIEFAGKTGSAEYCDNIAQAKNLCIPDNWPVHAWYVGYAPYTDPEIAILAFVYNGGEGSTVAAPIVYDVMKAYFELKDIDSGTAQ